MSIHKLEVELTDENIKCIRKWGIARGLHFSDALQAFISQRFGKNTKATKIVFPWVINKE